MISIPIIKFFFYLALPWLIGKGLSMLSKAGSSSSKLKKNSGAASEDGASSTAAAPAKSLKERLIIALVIVLLFNYVSLIFWNEGSLNFFQETCSATNAPSFMLRENYKAFLAKKSAAEPLFDRAVKELGDLSFRHDEDELRDFRARRYACKNQGMLQWIIGLRWTLAGTKKSEPASDASEASSQASAETDATVNYDQESVLYEKYQYIFDRLKSPGKRTIYLKYGEEAFLDCHFCQEDMDYLYFIGPIVVSSYIVFLLVAGALTSLERKSNWRNIYILFCGVLIVCELFYYIAPNEMASLDLYASLFPDDDKATVYQKLECVRHVCFSVALLVGLLFDNGYKRSEVDIVRDVLVVHEQSLAMNQAARLQKLAMLYDGTLRKHYVEHYEKAEKVWNSDEYTKSSTEIMKKYDIPKMMDLAGHIVDDILEEFVLSESQDQLSQTSKAAVKTEPKSDKKKTGSANGVSSSGAAAAAAASTAAGSAPSSSSSSLTGTTMSSSNAIPNLSNAMDMYE